MLHIHFQPKIHMLLHVPKMVVFFINSSLAEPWRRVCRNGLQASFVVEGFSPEELEERADKAPSAARSRRGEFFSGPDIFVL